MFTFKNQFSDTCLITERLKSNLIQSDIFGSELIKHQQAMKQLRDEVMKPYRQMREHERNYKRFFTQMRGLYR